MPAIVPCILLRGRWGRKGIWIETTGDVEGFNPFFPLQHPIHINFSQLQKLPFVPVAVLMVQKAATEYQKQIQYRTIEEILTTHPCTMVLKCIRFTHNYLHFFNAGSNDIINVTSVYNAITFMNLERIMDFVQCLACVEHISLEVKAAPAAKQIASFK